MALAGDLVPSGTRLVTPDLRGSERDIFLARPYLGAPSCFARKFSSILVKSLLSTHVIYSETDHISE